MFQYGIIERFNETNDIKEQKYIHDVMLSENSGYSQSMVYHRQYGPAYRFWGSSGMILMHEIWCRYGRITRDNEPANTSWYPNGTLHTLRWYLDGSLHRVDGPALIVYRYKRKIQSMKYYLNGVELLKEIHDWVIAVGISDCANMSPAEIALFKLTWGDYPSNFIVT